MNQNEGMTDPTLGGIAIKSGISKIPARPSAAHVPNKGTYTSLSSERLQITSYLHELTNS